MGKKTEQFKTDKKRKVKRKSSCSSETRMDENCSSAFVVGEEGRTQKSSTSLQEAFHNFRRLKQEELRASQDQNSQKNCDPVRMNLLRKKFLMQCKKYRGVPYKKKYHEPGTQEYNSALFLDCCGLIRRVLRDLHKDFRFKVGPWNQAYMYDTLPQVVNSESEMRPGDLVFISGEYFNEKSKKQLHNIVHVEVWAGEGSKTIGARWHKGKVQIFDSYKFTSTSYHNMVYHFRSLDTWLQGTCKSFCEKHPWKRNSTFHPSKMSVFYGSQNSSQANELKTNELNEGSDIEDASGDDLPQETPKNNKVLQAVPQSNKNQAGSKIVKVQSKKKVKQIKKSKSPRTKISSRKVVLGGSPKTVANVESTLASLDRDESLSSRSTSSVDDVTLCQKQDSVSSEKDENAELISEFLIGLDQMAVNLVESTLECALAEMQIELLQHH